MDSTRNGRTADMKRGYGPAQLYPPRVRRITLSPSRRAIRRKSLCLMREPSGSP
jgi:hypothetical protein